MPYLSEAMQQILPVQSGQFVARQIQMNEAEARSHFVVVSHLLDLVLGQIEPEQTLGDEGVVEPLESVM